jgi:ATP-dependent Clp protease adaptor protein ClpS
VSGARDRRTRASAANVPTIVAPTAPAADVRSDTEEKVAYARGWNVVVHDDPVNLMSYVTWVFQRVFGYARDKAERHMMEVHVKGRSILWTGDLEPAESYVKKLQAALLLATLERVE